MSGKHLIPRIVQYIRENGGGPECETGVEGLLAICRDRATRFEPTCYQPSFCLVLQGRKEVHMGGHRLAFGAGESVIVSHQVPLLAKVTEATEREPFVALAMAVDHTLVRELDGEIGGLAGENGRPRALQVGATDALLIDAVTRLFGLVDNPVETKVLGPLIRREIHYRLLVAPHGSSLRQLLRPRSHASQISRAIDVIRRDFARPLTVPDLARVAGMSGSTFHQHFKALTATTPLQYQKSLRLLEARGMLAEGQSSVTEVALEVGYQSPTQFSREYSRRFGHAPRHDLPSVSQA